MTYVPWNQLSNKQRELVKEQRSDIPNWNRELMEYQFEYHKTAPVAGTRELKRIAARVPAAIARRKRALIDALLPPPPEDTRYPEKRLSSCPTFLSVIRD